MYTRKWSRESAVIQLRREIWRYFTHVAQPQVDLHIEAAALLQMAPAELLTLAQAHFMLSSEIQRLLSGMSGLMRRLATTTVDEEERSAERIRGPIQWGPTLAAQTATAIRHVYVTAPARRAYDTPENQVLVAALNAVVEVGKRSGWNRLGEKHLAGEVRARTQDAQQWLSRRALAGIPLQTPNPRTLKRVSTGRARRRYQPAVDVVRRHQRMIRQLDAGAIRLAIEQHALVTSNDDVLFELLCAFEMERALSADGWSVSIPGLLPTRRFLCATRDGVRLDIFYQQTPASWGVDALYERVQHEHGFTTLSALRPDFVMRLQEGEQERWLVVEVKGGPSRTVEASARAALLDLMAYRRNFRAQLSDNPEPYGLGIAWGAELEPVKTSEAILCSSDCIGQALRVLID
jgi:hypothetical protein